MNINKLYSTKILAVKAIISFLIPIIVQLSAILVNGNDVFLLILVLMIASSLLFAASYIFTVFCIRRERTVKIGRLVLLDIISLLLPAIASALIAEVVDVIINGANFFAGIFIILFGLLYSLVSVSFWLVYLINAAMNKNK